MPLFTSDSLPVWSISDPKVMQKQLSQPATRICISRASRLWNSVAFPRDLRVMCLTSHAQTFSDPRLSHRTRMAPDNEAPKASVTMKSHDETSPAFVSELLLDCLQCRYLPLHFAHGFERVAGYYHLTLHTTCWLRQRFETTSSSKPSEQCPRLSAFIKALESASRPSLPSSP